MSRDVDAPRPVSHFARHEQVRHVAHQNANGPRSGGVERGPSHAFSRWTSCGVNGEQQGGISHWAPQPQEKSYANNPVGKLNELCQKRDI